MAGIGGFGIRINGTTNFANSDTTVTSVTLIDGFIGEVTGITIGEQTRSEIDVSSFDSANNIMEFVGGQIDPGTIDIELNYEGDELQAALDAMTGVNEVWQISFPDESIFRSDGFFTKAVGGDTNPNGKISGTASIKLSGIPTASTSFTAPGAPIA